MNLTHSTANFIDLEQTSTLWRLAVLLSVHIGNYLNVCLTTSLMKHETIIDLLVH